ncbi:MAG: two-component regulator propeller domain-containing protein [Bacteroidota bacterium]
MNGWRWVVVGTLCALGVSAPAQGVGTWRNFTSMKNVSAVASGGAAYWASTSGGLFRWSPADNSYLKLTSAEGFQSITLTAVAVDPDGTVWSGSSNGYLHVYQPSTGSLRVIVDLATATQTNKQINGISIAGDTVLICTEFGLSVFRRSRFEFGDSYTRFGTIPTGTRIAAIAALIASNRLWVGITDHQHGNWIASAPLDGTNILVPTAWTLDVLGDGSALPTAMAEFNGSVYAGTANGLYVRTQTGWTPVAGFSGVSITAMTVSGNLLVVATTGTQLMSLDASGSNGTIGPALPFPPTSLASPVVGTGPVVVGTNGGGLAVLNGSAWSFHAPNGPNSNEFTGVTVDQNGIVWAASGPANGSGIYRYDGASWTSYTTANSVLPANEFYRMSVGCDGSVWGSSWGWGMVEFPNGGTTLDSAHIFNANVGMAGVSNNPSFIVGSNVVCDGAGNLWVSVLGAVDRNILAVRKPDGSWRHLPVIYGGVKLSNLVEFAVDRALAVDGQDNLWATVRDPSNRGIACFLNGGVIDSVARVMLTSANGLPSDAVTTVVVDQENTVWIGTDKGIAIVLDPSNPRSSVAAYKPLLGETVNTIAVDALNQKWVGTPEGVVLLSPDGTQQLASYTVETTNGKLIDNDILSIAADPKTGVVYFASASGLASLYTTAAAPVETPAGFTVYPNPYRVPSASALTIDGLLGNSKIKILSANGNLVRDLTTDGGRIGFWDGRDNQGNVVSSGVYFIIGYTDDGNTVKGKVAVLKR